MYVYNVQVCLSLSPREALYFRDTHLTCRPSLLLYVGCREEGFAVLSSRHDVLVVSIVVTGLVAHAGVQRGALYFPSFPCVGMPQSSLIYKYSFQNILLLFPFRSLHNCVHGATARTVSLSY